MIMQRSGISNERTTPESWLRKVLLSYNVGKVKQVWLALVAEIS